MRILTALVVVLASAWSARAQQPHTICELQEYDAQGLSPHVGEMVVTRGVVTLPPGYLQSDYTVFYIEASGCGIEVFRYLQLPFAVGLGDSVQVTGQLVDYISGTGAGAVTQIHCDTPDQVVVLGSGNPEPEPTDMTIVEVQAEANEGRLLRTSGVIVFTDHSWRMDLDDGTGVLEVYRSFNDSTSFYSFGEGDTLRVTGVVSQYDRTPPYFEGYELIPRFQRDLERWHINAVEQTRWGVIKAMYR